MIDFSVRFAAQASSRLESQLVVWLTTVDAAGRPQPRPVWFHWDGQTILIFSQEHGAKVRHIARNPLVSIHLNSDAHGDEVTVLLGEARILPGWPKGPRVEAYVKKYQEGMTGIGFTPESFQKEYNTPIEITPTSVRGF